MHACMQAGGRAGAQADPHRWGPAAQSACAGLSRPQFRWSPAGAAGQGGAGAGESVVREIGGSASRSGMACWWSEQSTPCQSAPAAAVPSDGLRQQQQQGRQSRRAGGTEPGAPCAGAASPPASAAAPPAVSQAPVEVPHSAGEGGGGRAHRQAGRQAGRAGSSKQRRWGQPGKRVLCGPLSACRRHQTGTAPASPLLLPGPARGGRAGGAAGGASGPRQRGAPPPPPPVAVARHLQQALSRDAATFIVNAYS